MYPKTTTGLDEQTPCITGIHKHPHIQREKSAILTTKVTWPKRHSSLPSIGFSAGFQAISSPSPCSTGGAHSRLRSAGSFGSGRWSAGRPQLVEDGSQRAQPLHVETLSTFGTARSGATLGVSHVTHLPPYLPYCCHHSGCDVDIPMARHGAG